MLFPNYNSIRVYDTSVGNNANFFTGGLDFNTLENYDPIVTGYAFIIWLSIPSWVDSATNGAFKHFTERNFKSFEGLSDIELQTQAYQYGFNNNEYNVPAGITKNNTEFTLKHQEYSGSPVKNMYQVWVSGIADPETGIATYPRLYNCDYSMKNHTGTLLYIMTRPDANNVSEGINNIEFAALYTNAFPTKIPLGNLNYSNGEHNLIETDIAFKGNMHIGPKVDELAKEKLKEAYSFVTEGMFEYGVKPSAEKLETFNFGDITTLGNQSIKTL
jgi:hypothetical protein